MIIKEIVGDEANDLLVQSSRYMAELYPADSNHLVNLDELLAPENLFIGAWIEGQIVGCIALIAKQGYAEIKRLFVDPACRGQQVGRKLLQKIEDQAVAKGYEFLRLETGIYQPASIQLYEKAGYHRISPFGDYQPDPLSLFMEKDMRTLLH